MSLSPSSSSPDSSAPSVPGLLHPLVLVLRPRPRVLRSLPTSFAVGSGFVILPKPFRGFNKVLKFSTFVMRTICTSKNARAHYEGVPAGAGAGEPFSGVFTPFSGSGGTGLPFEREEGCTGLICSSKGSKSTSSAVRPDTSGYTFASTGRPRTNR